MIILNLLPFSANSQDVSFSQFYANRLYMNPALAGIEKDVRRLFINYRNQWPGIGNTYNTYSASYDQYIEDIHGGIGFRLLNDVQGDGTILQYSMSLDYSYHLQVSRKLYLSGGIEASFVQQSMKTDGFIFEDMIDPATGQVLYSSGEYYTNYNSIYPDFTAGIGAYLKNYYFGVSLAHILKPYASENRDVNTRVPRKFNFYAGGVIPIYEKRLGKEVVQLSPNIIYQQQSTFKQFNYGLEGIIENQYIAGVWLRQNLGIHINSLIFSGGFVTQSFRIRYSYDRHLSPANIRLPVLSAHEISIIISMGTVKKIKHEAIKCPKI